MAGKPTLIEISGTVGGHFVVGEGEALLLGRSLRAHLCLDDTFASRRHCQLAVRDGVLTLEDLASANGTFLNGQKVERAEVRSGDLIEVGAYKPGASKALDRAVALQPRLVEFLRQGSEDFSELQQTLERLQAVLKGGKS